MSEKQEIMKSIEQFKKEPSEFLEWLKKEPREPEKEWKELKPRIAPTCKYCRSVVEIQRGEERPVFRCTGEDKMLSKEEVVKPDITDEVTEQVNDIARKVARLILRSSEESDDVYKYLIETEQQGDESWSKMLRAIGKDTPEIGKEINNMNVPPFMLGWAVLSTKFLYEEYDKLNLEESKEQL